MTQELFEQQPLLRSSGRRSYRALLTADVNAKGVLDVDTVKGCTHGMAAQRGGCYGGCYAAKIAKFRGLKFEESVVRKVYSTAQAREIETAVSNAPEGFFRVGTMGDPSHAWQHTLEVVEWLAPLAIPVIVTKHWQVATDLQLARFVACGAVFNTSVSALDTAAQLEHRIHQLQRYERAGGVSVARVVSCNFNTASARGEHMSKIQESLFALPLVIDNPLRVSASDDLVRQGIITVDLYQDLGDAPVLISKHKPSSYTGSCDKCTDKCGLAFRGASHPKPRSKQTTLTL